MGKRYDVALWLAGPGGPNFPEYVDDSIEADSPLDAVLCLMGRYDLARVVYAAVGEVDGDGRRVAIVRFKRGFVARSEMK